MKLIRERKKEKANTFEKITATITTCFAIWIAIVYLTHERVPILDQEAATAPQQENVQTSEQTKENAKNTYTIYKYTNNQGNTVMVSDLERVPQEYRQKITVVGEKADTEINETTQNQNTTPIEIIDNRVFIPTEISYNGRTVTAKLLLDTGATGISISHVLAQKLNARPTSTKIITMANGSKTKAYSFTCDYISVGAKTKKSADIDIIITEDNKESGLLGMAFLAEFPHTIDIKNKTIKWL